MSSSGRPRHTHRKRWGQNFLRNPSAVEKISAAVAPGADEIILEIGPGEGVLTRALLAHGVPIRVVEIDPRLIERLRSDFASEPVEIMHADALEAELPVVPFRAVGNLPYNVANPIIRRVLRSPACRGAVFMVQKEVANRYAARRGDPDYGFLTLVTRLWAVPRKILTLGPGSFDPPPKVSSAVLTFEPTPARVSTERETLEDLISAAFRQPRKKLSNNLQGWRGAGRDQIEDALSSIGLDRSARAQQLDLENYDSLAAEILKLKEEAGGSSE